jgi:chromosome segregation ATPase
LRDSGCLFHAIDLLSRILPSTGGDPEAKGENRALLSSQNNLDKLYKDASNSLTTLERSHQFTMEELEHKRNELKESQKDVSALSSSLSSKDSTIKDLHASNKFLS